MFSEDDASTESNKTLIARVKQIYRQQMPLLCNVSENESI